METKEAIEFVEFELSRYRNPDFVMDKEDIKNKNIMKGIISLLQQGEAYRQMWEEWKEDWGSKCICEYVEHKYFPKEAKQDETDNK